jgi:hypothetical protein
MSKPTFRNHPSNPAAQGFNLKEPKPGKKLRGWWKGPLPVKPKRGE